MLEEKFIEYIVKVFSDGCLVLWYALDEECNCYYTPDVTKALQYTSIESLKSEHGIDAKIMQLVEGAQWECVK